MEALLKFKDHFSDSAALYAGYLHTWYATTRYVAEQGFDPVTDVERSLSRDWGDSQKSRAIRWPLYLRAGKIPASRSSSKRHS
ncbi:MAG: hypothetical protein M3P26_07620 [Gemmatimonadota bacterium]|nr:hypothetical protein [Gemmatimonadota bacterium]